MGSCSQRQPLCDRIFNMENLKYGRCNHSAQNSRDKYCHNCYCGNATQLFAHSQSNCSGNGLRNQRCIDTGIQCKQPGHGKNHNGTCHGSGNDTDQDCSCIFFQKFHLPIQRDCQTDGGWCQKIINVFYASFIRRILSSRQF